MEELHKNLEEMTVSERKEYYEALREKCFNLEHKQLDIGQGIIKKVYPLLRNYKIEIEGEENVPKYRNVLFVANHSNSHDAFTAYETFSLLGRNGSEMVGSDCLVPATRKIFDISDATLLDRYSKEECQNAASIMAHKLLNGKNGWIYGESTWNLHPTLPMHNIKNGAVKISLISEVPVVPVIVEYVENEGIIKSESKLINRCIIRFGKPMYFNYTDSLPVQSKRITDEMTRMRKELWKELGIKRDSLDDIDKLEYLNHTYIKKFKALGFTYDSEKEEKFLLYLNGEPRENEYTLNEEGIFVPGITKKDSKIRKLFK